MARGTSCSPPWRSITKWREARSPPAWRTLGTLSPWCSWTAWRRRTSSTASRAAEPGRAQPAATPWTGLPSWSAAVCGGGPRSSKSKSPIWRMWTPSTAGHGSSSLPSSRCSTSSTGCTTSDRTVLLTWFFFQCVIVYGPFFSFIFLFFSSCFYTWRTIEFKTATLTRHNKSWLRKDWVMDQVLVKIVFIFAVFESLVPRSFYFLNMYCNWDLWHSPPNTSPFSKV